MITLMHPLDLILVAFEVVLAVAALRRHPLARHGFIAVGLVLSS